MSWVNTPSWLKKIFRQLVWEIPTLENNIYLTFDDGPTPGITSQVLALLLKHNAKATFFCLGSKIEQYPSVFNEIKTAGHSIGNHGYLHMNGFYASISAYYENAKRGAYLTDSKLFRPPYGRIAPWQTIRLKKEYTIIMWSIMSMDFDQKLSAEQCLYNVIRNIKPGSIIVFHDTEKAKGNLLELLPALLTWLDSNGYHAKALELCEKA